VPYRDLSDRRDGTSSASMREQVMGACQRQVQRYEGLNIRSNSRLNSRQVRQFCQIDESGQNMIKQAVYELGLSARAYDKILKISRTIADLEGNETIASYHVGEAIQYRRLDRNL